MEPVVQFGTEHDVAYIIEQHESEQNALFIDHGEGISSAACNDFHHIAQQHIGRDGDEIALDDRIDIEQGQNGAVFMMRKQFAFLRQTHRIDAVRLENDDGQVRTDGHDHQRKKQVVTACKLGDKEYARERRMP